MQCPSCNGTGCKDCDGGYFDFDGCPNTYCSGAIDAIDLFDLFEKGLPPVSGGMLDQAASFIGAAQYFGNEERRVKNERSSRNPYQS